MTANSWDSILLSPVYLLSHTLLVDSTESTQTASTQNTRILSMVGCRRRGATSGLRFGFFSFLAFGVLLEVLCFAVLTNRCFIVIGSFHMTNVSSSLSSQVSSNRLRQYSTITAHFCVLFCWLSDILDTLEGKDPLLALCKTLVSSKPEVFLPDFVCFLIYISLFSA